MTSFTKEQVEKIAKLARMTVSDQEKESYANDLSVIFQVLEQLLEVDTKGIEPLVSVSAGPIYMRKDEVTDGNCADKILSNAKNSVYNYFVVPKVVE